MTTYYCIHGATNNGDGTTSAEAGSLGGVGAFNNAKTCLLGTEAGLTAPPYTIIYKTNHNATDITVTQTGDATFGYGVGYPNRVTNIFDDGTTWAGESGQFTFQFNSSGTLTSTDGTTDDLLNNYVCDLIALAPYGFALAVNYSSSSTRVHEYHDGILKNIYLMKLLVPASNDRMAVSFMRRHQPILVNCIRDVNATTGARYISQLASHNSPPSRVTIDGLTLNMIQSGASTLDATLLSSSITQYGPAAKNVNIVGDTTNPWILGCDVDGITLPSVIDLTIEGDVYKMKTVGAADTYNFINNYFGVITSWSAGLNYPYLEATLPDGSTPWVIKVDTSAMVSGTSNRIFDYSQIYDLASGVKTLTSEVLIPNSFSSPTGLEWWAVFSYQDTNGDRKTLDTLSIDALTSSVASWSVSSYAGVSYLKYKFEVTTPTAVAQNTEIVVTLYTTVKQVLTNNFYFVDPELRIS